MAQPVHTVTIRLEGNTKFEGFDCRGRSKSLCDGCRLRFLCLSERNDVAIPSPIVKKHKIKDLKSLVGYMFGEGKIEYSLMEHSSILPEGGTQTRFVMKVKHGR